ERTFQCAFSLRRWSQCRHAQSRKNVGQQKLRAEFVRHPMARKHDDRRVIAGGFDYFADCRIDRLIDVANRVPCDRRDFRIVTGMRTVMQMPALMADAMAFGEHLRKEIPAALSE